MTRKKIKYNIVKKFRFFSTFMIQPYKILKEKKKLNT